MLAYVLDHTGPYIVLDQPPYAIHIGHEFGSALDGERTRARQRDIDGLLDAAGPPRQHQHPVRQEYGLVDLVSDEEDGLAALLPDAYQLGLHDFPGLGVKRRKRLVHEEDVGIDRERA